MKSKRDYKSGWRDAMAWLSIAIIPIFAIVALIPYGASGIVKIILIPTGFLWTVLCLYTDTVGLKVVRLVHNNTATSEGSRPDNWIEELSNYESENQKEGGDE